MTHFHLKTARFSGKMAQKGYLSQIAFLIINNLQLV
jgi:hypothetical protein